MAGTYQHPPNDGADWRCLECKKYFKHKEVWLVATTDGKRRILCDGCLDEDWKAQAAQIADLEC